MNPDIWLLKLAAFLYDVPEKAIRHRRRDEWWAAHFQTLTGVESTEFEGVVKEAHRLAASTDRFSLGDRLGSAAKGAMTVEFLKAPLALHLLSAYPNPWIEDAGRQLSNVAEITSDAPSLNPAFQAVESCLNEFETAFRDSRTRFLALWRLLPEWLPQRNPSIPSLIWEHLPADTRTPDHSVRDAAVATSAIVTALPEPALVLFSFGPIQPFIRASRRTQDFWMGSLLLSWLAWQAIRKVAEDYGPDTIIYPDLHARPFVDLWLREVGLTQLPAPSSEALATSSLPTRFLAILPKAGAEKIAPKAGEKLEEEWKRIAAAVKEEIETVGGTVFKNAKSVWEALWDQQALKRSPFECRWVILPWRATGAECLGMARQWIDLDEPVRRLYETLDRALPRGKFTPAHTYGLLYDLLDRGHESRKRLHVFEQMAEESGEKCTLCGERDALRPADPVSRPELRKFWASLAEKVPGHIAPSGEMLCTVCLTRRLAGKLYARFRNLKLDYHFTSTAGVAAAPFQEALLQKGLDSDARDFTEALKNLPKRLFERLPGEYDRQSQPKFRASPVPRIRRQLGAGMWEEFAQVDGEWLFEEAYERSMKQAKNAGIPDAEVKLRKAQQVVGVLRRAAAVKGISPPSPYFAVLYFDGDEMGGWLRGEKAPGIGEILHPQAAKGLLTAAAKNQQRAVEVLPFYETLKDLQRPMGPALHRAVSRALRNFALEIARTVVEEQHRGRLVYAGGDELLALLPIDDALSAAWTLRRLWSGDAFAKDGLLGLAGFVQKNGRLLTLMGGATASAGIAYAHYLFPLGLVIEAAYGAADKQAKETLGRDAVGFAVIKRSGERIETGARWRYGSLATAEILSQLAEAFDPERGFLSRRLVYQLRELNPAIRATEAEAQIAILEKQLSRHVSRREDEQKHRHLQNQLRGLLRALHESSTMQKRSPLEHFLDLLFVAEFLGARGDRG